MLSEDGGMLCTGVGSKLKGVVMANVKEDLKEKALKNGEQSSGFMSAGIVHVSSVEAEAAIYS